MTAMSVLGSVPTTLALSSRLSESRTRISSAFETTWLFVMMYPLGSAITPDPRLRSRWSGGASNRRRKNSSPKNRRRRGSSNGPKLWPSGSRLIRVVEMFTTAGVTALATSTKLGAGPSAGGGMATGFGTLGASGTACPIGQTLDRDLFRLVHLLRRRLLQVIGRQLHLDDVGAQLGRDLRCIGDDVERRLPFLADLAAAGIRPDHERQAVPFGFFPDLAGLLVHALAVRRPGIDGEPHRHAAEPQRVAHAARDRRRWVLVLMEDIVVVQLQDQRNLARELRRTRLQEPERRSVGVAAGLDRQLEVVAGIVAPRIDREAPGRAVLEALVHRQNQAFAGPLQRPVVQDARQARLHAGVIRTVPAQDVAHTVRHGSLLSFPLDECLSQADIFRTADQQRHPLVQRLRLHIEDGHGACAGTPACP